MSNEVQAQFIVPSPGAVAGTRLQLPKRQVELDEGDGLDRGLLSTLALVREGDAESGSQGPSHTTICGS